MNFLPKDGTARVGAGGVERLAAENEGGGGEEQEEQGGGGQVEERGVGEVGSTFRCFFKNLDPIFNFRDEAFMSMIATRLSKREPRQEVTEL